MSQQVNIQQVKEAFNQAIRDKDANKANSFFSPNSVLFLLAPPLQEKLENEIDSLNDLENWFSTFEGKIGLTSTEIVIAQNENLAYLHSLEHLTGNRTDGSFTDTWYRETLCFIKLNNEWKIIHQHQSFPMYMDGSDKAATDLMPV